MPRKKKEKEIVSVKKTLTSKALIFPPKEKLVKMSRNRGRNKSKECKKYDELMFKKKFGEYFTEVPVTMGEFIDSPHYLNLEGICRRKIRKELINIFGDEIHSHKLSKYLYGLMTGGIGIGKSFTGGIVFAYLVYRMECLRDPQAFYGYAPRTKLAFMNMSTSRTNALHVLFSEVKARVDTSPWFQENCRYETRYTNLLKFPKNIFILPGDSSETTFEGYNIIGGIIDEADSHKITTRKDYADQGFDTISIRIKSRSNPKFGHIGFLLIIGSKKKQKGFIQRKLDEFKELDNAYGVHIPIWEARDKSDFKLKRNFYFNALTKKVCEKPDDKVKNPAILRIPVEYSQEFIINPDKALRDLAGFPPYARQAFFAFAEKIQSIGINSPLQSPVKNISGSDIIFHDWFKGGKFKHIAHFDLGLNKDGSDFCGLAIGHLATFKMTSNEVKPVVHMDLMVRIEAPPGGEIILSDLRKIIYYLRDQRGFVFRKVTFDGWQSTESIQQLKKKRIRAEVISVDKTNEAYDGMKEVIYDDRFISYYYQPFIDECLELEHTDSGKVDHPPEGSKDVSDACAAVTSQLIKRKGGSTIMETPIKFEGQRIINTNNKFYERIKGKTNQGT